MAINLNAAKKAKNDEFYTKLSDIENELSHYKEHLKGKKIFLNCDDHTKSNFYRYFELNFDFLEIESVTATHYHTEKSTYKLVIDRDENDLKCIHKPEKLEQNGDFRSPESIAILKNSDIVITNPPFSLFREFVAQLVEYNKEFLVVGSMNAITYKEIFPLIKNDKLWLGINNLKEFLQPDGTIKKFGNINWYTNLKQAKRNDTILMYKKYTPKEYPKYDNYDAINVDKVVDIPKDYDEVMGVPITFLSKYNPKQFEILNICIPAIRLTTLRTNDKFKEYKSSMVTINEIECQKMYHRILIKAI